MKRKRKILLFLSVLALTLASLACSLPARRSRPASDSTPIPVSTEAVESLQENIQSAAESAAANQPVTLEITEAQLTSLVAFELESQPDLPFDDPQVFLRDGQVRINGKTQQGGLTLPVEIVLTVSADEQGQPHYQVVSAHVGPLPLPEAVLNRLTDQLDQALAGRLSPEENNLFIEDITVADGKMKISGHTRE